ncbi:MAG: carbohydrate ABC transporter permease [Lachnospiraceae bacterium]|nr:carbohydrate ABC transporter permease [Lachnospiraceae bacterium]
MKKTALNAGRHFLLLLLSFIAIFPLYWMVVSSLKGEGEIFNYSFLPEHFQLTNYLYAFQEMPILRMLGNSLLNSTIQMSLQLLTAVMVAYALMRWEFKGKALIYSLLTLTWLIPFQAIMIPNYVQINEWKLNGTLAAIILPNMVSAFACLSMYQSFQSFPRALIEAALIDGGGELAILTRVVLPTMKAGIASLGIMLFITSWNDYMWPMLVVRNLENAPIQIGLKSFVSSDVNLWGSLMAATTVSCLPIFILYLLLQRNIVDSFMKWGIK